jgi:hypothetical protein
MGFNRYHFLFLSVKHKSMGFPINQDRKAFPDIGYGHYRSRRCPAALPPTATDWLATSPWPRTMMS